MLSRERVLDLITRHRDACMVWSATRVLYRLGITGKRSPPSELLRRARRILEGLCEEGYLRPKPQVAQVPSGNKELAFLPATY